MGHFTCATWLSRRLQSGLRLRIHGLWKSQQMRQPRLTLQVPRMEVSLHDPSHLPLKVCCPPSSFPLMALVLSNGHAGHVLDAVAQSYCAYAYLGLLILTAVSLVGAGQRNVKRTSVKLIRNPSSKTATVSKPSSPPPVERPPTAIDPLSHVGNLR
jgi:hypothetical protein